MVTVEGEEVKKEVNKDVKEKRGFTERKPKLLSEEEIASIFKERRRSIIRRKEKREEKRKEKIELIEVEEAEEITEEEFLKQVARGLKIETEGAFSGTGGFETTDKKKKGESMSPPLEDSAGVCYDEEKDVKINLSDDGKFIGASVNGTELNL